LSSAERDGVADYLSGRVLSRAGGASPRGADRARRLLHALGDPQDGFRAIHVAGTAGKGSVTTFVAAVLSAHGFRVGAYLSPHAYSVFERFQLDDRPVDAATAARRLADIAPAVADMDRTGHDSPTYFEVTTALAFQIFAAGRVDYAVVETGLGGLLDATNTISRPDKIAVITTIGLDHTELLGPTLGEIATQKAGILPRGGRALAVRDRSAEVVEAISAEARRRRCELEFVDTSACVEAATVDRGATVLRLADGRDLRLGLEGRHQAGNALLALRTVEETARRDGWALDPGAVRDGLRRARLPGRFERREWRGRPVVVDGAHNPIKLAAVVSTLQDLYPGRCFPWVLALKRDKDLHGVLDVIGPVASVVVATEFDATGADHAVEPVPATEIADLARRAGVAACVEPRPLVALQRAVDLSTGQEPIVVAGSFHLLAAVAGPRRDA